MQIGSSPLVRRSLDKALPEPRSLFGVFPAWNVMVGGSEGRTWSRQHEDGDVRGPPRERCCSQCPSLCSTHPRDLSGASFAALPLPLSLCLCQHSVCPRWGAVISGLLKLEKEWPKWEVQQSPAVPEPCLSQNKAPVLCWSLAASCSPSSSRPIPFKERPWNMFWFHFATGLLKTFLSSLFSQFVFFASSAFRRNKILFFPYPLRIIFFRKFRQDLMVWTSLHDLEWVGSFSEKSSASYDCWAMQVTSK